MPAPGQPHRITDQPVEYPRRDVIAKAAVRHALLDNPEPDALYVSGRSLHVLKPGPLPQVLQLILVDRGRIRLLPGQLQRGQHYVVQGLDSALPAGEHFAVPDADRLEETDEDLVDDLILGIEVVIKAAGEDADDVSDLPGR